jgi:hypothetical protein
LPDEEVGELSDDTGLADPAEVKQFVGANSGSAVSSMSAEERAEKVVGEVNARLAAQGVPHVAWSFGSGANNSGEFHPSTWTIVLDKDAFDPAKYDTGDTFDHSQVLELVYHEARHAEQNFRGARERAGLGATADQIVAATHVPQEVASEAAANPIKECDKSQYEAEEWYQAAYGSGKDHHEAVEADGKNRLQEYHALPDEKDAFETGDKVADEYIKQGEAGNN